jgi:DHA1 family tetracycline resistance protein-like MFS transporter
LACYGLAAEGWMIYAIIAAAALAHVTAPAIQGLISRSVSADEQGGVQGSLTSLSGISSILGSLIMPSLFAHFIKPDARIYLPGAAFFFAALLVFVGMILAVRSFRRAPAERPVAVTVKQTESGVDYASDARN